jgi:hypothetical protein
LVIFLLCGICGLCKSVFSMIVEKARMNAASALAKGLPGPRYSNNLPANASINLYRNPSANNSTFGALRHCSLIMHCSHISAHLSMHWDSPGSRNSPRNVRRAASKLECSPENSKVRTYSRSTAAWKGWISAGPLLMYSPI